MQGKLLLINSLLMRKIIYTIAIYGGMTENHGKQIQIIINNAARYICNLGKRTNIMKLMTKMQMVDLQGNGKIPQYGTTLENFNFQET